MTQIIHKTIFVQVSKIIKKMANNILVRINWKQRLINLAVSYLDSLCFSFQRGSDSCSVLL